MLLGVGIDILSLSRFGALLARRNPSTVAKRICSPTEIQRFQSLLPASHLASENKENDKTLRYLSTRWVLKEAAYKALSAHISTGLTWKSLEVDHLPSGQPTIRYSPADTTLGRAPGLVGMEIDLMCTLSHDAGVVVGVVIAQTKG